MLRKFAIWFVVFGLSFLVSDTLHWTEQGKAFLLLHLGSGIAVATVILIIVMAAGIATRHGLESSAFSMVAIVWYVVGIAIVLFATWVATKIFNIDFYVAYQIMAFGQCLSTEKKEDN